MTPTVQIDLREAITAALRIDGCYVGEIGTVATQGLVDAQWAAHLAARSLGTRVKVALSEERRSGGPAKVILHVTPRSN